MGEINRGLLGYDVGNKFTFYQFSSTENEDRTCSFDVILFFKTYSNFLLLEIILLVHCTPYLSSAATHLMQSVWLFQVKLNNQGG